MIPVELYFLLAIFLLLNLFVGLIRIYRGPNQATRLLAVQLFGTTTVAILLTLAEGMGVPALRDVALLFALLAAIVAIAFVRLPPEGAEEESE
jgi:multicomponent Na+:H+ antiporter subunit F